MIFKKILFIWKAEHSREEGKPRRTCISWLTALVAGWGVWGWAWWKPGGRDSSWVSQGHGRILKIWVICCCHHWHMIKEQKWQCGSQDTNVHFYIRPSLENAALTYCAILLGQEIDSLFLFPFFLFLSSFLLSLFLPFFFSFFVLDPIQLPWSMTLCWILWYNFKLL